MHYAHVLIHISLLNCCTSNLKKSTHPNAFSPDLSLLPHALDPVLSISRHHFHPHNRPPHSFYPFHSSITPLRSLAFTPLACH